MVFGEPSLLRRGKKNNSLKACHAPNLLPKPLGVIHAVEASTEQQGSGAVGQASLLIKRK